MGYIESQLLPGERIVARAARNKVVLIGPTLLVALFAAGALGAFLAKTPTAVVLGLLLLAVMIGGIAWVAYKSADFAVTTSRLILKQGWISRRIPNCRAGTDQYDLCTWAVRAVSNCSTGTESRGAAMPVLR